MNNLCFKSVIKAVAAWISPQDVCVEYLNAI